MGSRERCFRLGIEYFSDVRASMYGFWKTLLLTGTVVCGFIVLARLLRFSCGPAETADGTCSLHGHRYRVGRSAFARCSPWCNGAIPGYMLRDRNGSQFSLSLRDSISKILFSSSSSFFLLFIIINATFLPFSYVQNSRTRIEFIPIIFSLVFLEDRLITVENSLPCF